MDRNQFNRCVEQYADRLFRFVFSSLRNREQAEDVVQESFARVWEIQPGNPLLMLILSSRSGLFKKTALPDGTPLVVLEVMEEECEGLMRAAFFAKRNRTSLGGLLLQEKC